MMNPVVAVMNQMAAAGLSALLNTLWYAGAVVVLLWAGLRLFPRVNAATRYWMWVAVLGFLLVLPWLPWLPGLVGRRAAAVADAPAATATGSAAAARPGAVVTLTLPESAPGGSPWPLWLLAAWVAAAGWQMARLARSMVSVRRLKAGAEAASEVLPVQLRRRVRVVTSAGVGSPVAVVGYLHPAVVVQPGLLEKLEEGERQDVLLHELAHLARYDDWVVLAVRAVAAVLVLHPLTGFVLGRIEREREMACDDFVVARTGAAGSYARSLARLHDLRWATGTRLLAAEFLGRNVSLSDRIESLLRRGREFSARPSQAGLGAGAVVLAVLLGAGGMLPNWIAIAQTAAGPKEFAAASIKPGNPGERRSMLQMMPGGRFNATNVRLKMLILFAYDIKGVQLENLPSWASSKTYSIEAVAPPGTPNLAPQANAQMERRMMQALLASRFGLKVHTSTRQLPVYELVVAKGGPKLQPFTGKEGPPPVFGPKPGNPGGEMGGVKGGVGKGVMAGPVLAEQVMHGPKGSPNAGFMLTEPGRMYGNGNPISALTNTLTAILGRMVIDQTGLTGKYDLDLTWTPEPGEAGGMGFGGAEGMKPNTNFSGPSMFTALHEQLGLQLKSAKGPVQVVVVDEVKPPSAN